QVSVAKVLLGVVGVAVVVVVIAVPTVIFLNEDRSTGDRTYFTLQDVFNASLKPRSYGVRWISDSEYLTGSQGSVHLENVLKQTSEVFLSKDVFEEKEASDYMVSADRNYVAFLSNYSKLWRHSFTATYWLYDMHSKKFLNSDIPPEVQYFSWAPVGDKMAFVWNNDLFVKINGTTPPVAVTDTGEENVIFNGIPDWVYEEEMFSSGQGLWWSPGGKRVAYVQTNDTEVHHIEYSWYGQGQYPQTVSIPYPKAGTPNPVVKLFVVDTDNAMRVSEVVVPDSFGSTEHYLATVTWLTDERIAVQWLKRVQQHLILQIYNFNGSRWDPVEFSSQRLEVNSESGWIGRFSPAEPVFDPDGSSYYLVMSDASGYKHLHRVVKGKSEAVTSGQWEVVDILKVTEDSVYYSSNEDGERPGGRNVYRLTKDNVKTCLTCSVNQERCQYNSASFSQNASFYLLGCRGPGIPYYSLMDTFKNTEVKYLENNDKFSSLIAGIEMPTVLTDSIDLYGFKLWYKMVLPPGFDRSKKYPLLIDVYAGPCSQKVNSVYQVSWATYLASTEKIIVASFDGRGSGFQGDKLMHTIYKRLGTYEVEDQITAAKEFIKMGFVDKDRIAIWGWSYGGYVTSMALGSGSGVFSCGMAVAPVSKWDYYDSIYTERYMMEPSENSLAYLNSTVTERAKNFHSVKYLLVHGTADDNVHFQQAAEISEALVEEQVDFEAMWYTDKDHALSDSAYQHVYTHMTHFLLRCFA
uniref:Dipeptidyl-peptidase 4 n=1 Tax=Tetraodon nigroviridis TaxID=99883 RepID=H3D6X4_TETNG